MRTIDAKALKLQMDNGISLCRRNEWMGDWKLPFKRRDGTL